MRTVYVLPFLMLLLSACGWHLRGVGGVSEAQLPTGMALSSDGRFSEMTLTVADMLQKYGIEEKDDARIRLVLKKEMLEKRTVAVNAIGSASQYELSLSMSYFYQLTSDTEIVPVEQLVSTKRVFDFDPGNTVSKTEEERQLVQEMRRELARRIIRFSSNLTDTKPTNE